MTTPTTQAAVAREYKMNLFDPSANSNKVWHGKAFTDGTFRVDFGRVRDGGKGMMNREKKLGSESAAVAALETLRREKLRKGYQDSAVLGGTAEIVLKKSADLETVAAKQIVGADDKTTAELIKYLAQVNIHQITHSTSISYNAASGAFSTPLGILTPDAVAEARRLLAKIENENSAGHVLRTQSRHDLIRDYFRLVPSDFGAKIPSSETLLDSNDKITAQISILDALEAALQPSAPVDSSASADKVFSCRLSVVPHDTEDGRTAFRSVKKLYESTKGGHKNVAGLKLIRLYEVEIESMKKNFDAAAQQLGNVRSDLWHGTRASNLLSILKGGLQIPKQSAGHCTGRMFGDGIYTSLQSTKALNYATDFWNKSGASNQRTFMFLTEAALGKINRPKARAGSLPKPGTDSTWIDAGTCGVMNNEVIVYDTKQINLKYLCEFGAV